MKVSDIATRVKRQFGDDVQAQITDADIVRWINDACLEIATNNHTNEGMNRGATPVVSGQSVYALPSDLLLLRAVRVNGRAVEGTTYEQLIKSGAIPDDADESTLLGTPQWYWVHNEHLNLVPTPDESLGTVDIMYVKTPDTMLVGVWDREPDVPVQYHLRILEYCIAQASELDDNDSRAQIKMQQFHNNLDKLKANGEQPESDSVYPSITYIGDGW